MVEKGTNQISDLPAPIVELYEESASLKGPPEATIARRAKSYSDFYEVATGFLNKQAKDEKSRDALDIAPIKNGTQNFQTQYEDVEEDLLNSSHEEFQSVHEARSRRQESDICTDSIETS